MTEIRETYSADKIRAVEFQAEVRQIKTMADGTVNVTINLPERCIEQAQVMMGWINMLVNAVVALDD